MEGGEPKFDWAGLVPHIVHPAQVAIVEAMLWVERPLSATELRDLFDEPRDHYLSLVSYHLRMLARHGAVEEAGHRQSRGARETYYVFTPSRNGSAAS
jgi:hypothetical protein